MFGLLRDASAAFYGASRVQLVAQTRFFLQQDWVKRNGTTANGPDGKPTIVWGPTGPLTHSQQEFLQAVKKVPSHLRSAEMRAKVDEIVIDSAVLGGRYDAFAREAVKLSARQVLEGT